MVKKANKIEILGPNERIPEGIRCVNVDPLEAFREIARNPGKIDEADPMANLYGLLEGSIRAPEAPKLPYEHAGQTIFPPGSPIPMHGFKPGG